MRAKFANRFKWDWRPLSEQFWTLFGITRWPLWDKLVAACWPIGELMTTWWPLFDQFGDHFGINLWLLLTLKPLSNQLWTVLGSIVSWLLPTLGSIWDHLATTCWPLWDQFGISWWTLWNYLRIIWWLLGDYFGITWRLLSDYLVCWWPVGDYFRTWKSPRTCSLAGAACSKLEPSWRPQSSDVVLITWWPLWNYFGIT